MMIFQNGLFTDQKWGDLAPALFEFVKIIHEPEYNVATWNLARRKVEGNGEDGWKVNGKQLKFYHFTGFDSGAHRIMLAQHAKEGEPVWNLSMLYEKMMYEKGQSELGKVKFKYAFYENGELIDKKERILFRSRLDVYNYFENPFNEECYLWMKANVSAKENNILTVCKKRFLYKALYKFTLFALRKKFKQKYKYYQNMLEQMQGKLDGSN